MKSRLLFAGTLFALLLTGCSSSGSPTVDLIVQDDPIEGWNLFLSTNNFTFTPEEIATGGVTDNKGYAMLIVNGQVITRLYSEWTYLPGLPVGNNTIGVALYHNDNTPVVVDGVEVSDAEVIVAAQK